MYDWIEKAAASLRGGQRPSSLAWAALLGLSAGVVCGPNLSCALLLVAAVLMRVNLPVLLVAFGLGTLLGWAGTGLTYATGVVLLDTLGLRAPLAAGGTWLPLALLDLDRYVVTGGLVWGGALGWLLARWVRHLARRQIGQLRRGQAEGATASWDREQSPPQQRAQLLLARLAWGKALGPATLPLATRWLGFGQAVGLATIVLAAWAGQGVIERRIVATVLCPELAQASRAQFTAESIRWNLLSGRLSAERIHVVWPASAERGQQCGLHIEHLEASLVPGAALRGQIEVAEARLSGVHRWPATEAAPDATVEAGGTEGETAAQAGEVAAVAELEGSDEAAALEHTYPASPWVAGWARQWVSGWPAEQTRLLQVRQWIQAIEQLARHDLDSPGGADAQPAWQGYRRARAALAWDQPRLKIGHLQIDSLAPEFGWGEKAVVHVRHLNSRPVVAAKPTHLVALDPERTWALEVQLNLHQLSGRHDLRIEVADLPIEMINQAPALEHRMQVSRGKIRLAGSGWCDGQQLEVRLDLHLKEFRAQWHESAPLWGHPAAAWNQALADRESWYLRGALCGTWQSPQVALNAEQLSKDLCQQLVQSGHAELADSVAAAPASGSEPTDAPGSPASPQELAAVEPGVAAQGPAGPDEFVAATEPSGEPVEAPEPPRPLAKEQAGHEDQVPAPRTVEPAPRRRAPRPAVAQVIPDQRLAEEESNDPEAASIAPAELSHSQTGGDLSEALSTVASSSEPANDSAASVEPRAPGQLPPAVARAVPSRRGPETSVNPDESDSDAFDRLVEASTAEQPPPAAGAGDSVAGGDDDQSPRRAELMPPWLAPKVALRAAQAAGQEVPRVPGPIELERGSSWAPAPPAPDRATVARLSAARPVTVTEGPVLRVPTASGDPDFDELPDEPEQSSRPAPSSTRFAPRAIADPDASDPVASPPNRRSPPRPIEPAPEPWEEEAEQTREVLEDTSASWPGEESDLTAREAEPHSEPSDWSYDSFDEVPDPSAAPSDSPMAGSDRSSDHWLGRFSERTRGSLRRWLPWKRRESGDTSDSEFGSREPAAPQRAPQVALPETDEPEARWPAQSGEEPVDLEPERRGSRDHRRGSWGRSWWPWRRADDRPSERAEERAELPEVESWDWEPESSGADRR